MAHALGGGGFATLSRVGSTVNATTGAVEFSLRRWQDQGDASVLSSIVVSVERAEEAVEVLFGWPHSPLFDVMHPLAQRIRV